MEHQLKIVKINALGITALVQANLTEEYCKLANRASALRAELASVTRQAQAELAKSLAVRLSLPYKVPRFTEE